MIKNYAIYTVVIGSYDDIKQPLVVDDRFDYILFSNDIKEDKIGVWQVRRFDYFNKDTTRMCRYVKTHPEELLFDYKFSIWMDANIQIQTGYLYEKSIYLYNNGIEIASMWHPYRNCIYDEAFSVVNFMVDYEDVVIRWCHKLRKEGYPQRNGLCETNVLFRVHSNQQINEINKLWWQCIDKYSRRDQLSYNYVLWKLGVSCFYLFGEGTNARNTKHLQLVKHQNVNHNHCSINSNEAWLMRYCWKNKEKSDEIAYLYYRLCAFPFPRLIIAIAGQIYRVKYLLENYGKHR